MQTLNALLKRYARQRPALWWAGNKPDVRDGQIARVIAQQVGLPSSTDDPLENNGMDRLERGHAAQVLALAGTTSLAYGSYTPRQQYVIEAKAALNDLTEDAVFLSNGPWNSDSPAWHPLTRSTFDCGIIGFDRENAFIFWVVEED